MEVARPERVEASRLLEQHTLPSEREAPALPAEAMPPRKRHRSVDSGASSAAATTSCNDSQRDSMTGAPARGEQACCASPRRACYPAGLGPGDSQQGAAPGSPPHSAAHSAPCGSGSIGAPPSPRRVPKTVRDVLSKARCSWLRNEEVRDLLLRWRDYGLRVSTQPAHRPPSGSVFLYNRRTLRFFRRDGHSWRGRGGKSFKEVHEKLRIGSRDALNCYYANAEDGRLQRRCYWLLDDAERLDGGDDIVLVHYLDGQGARTLMRSATEPAPTTSPQPRHGADDLVPLAAELRQAAALFAAASRTLPAAAPPPPPPAPAAPLPRVAPDALRNAVAAAAAAGLLQHLPLGAPAPAPAAPPPLPVAAAPAVHEPLDPARVLAALLRGGAAEPPPPPAVPEPAPSTVQALASMLAASTALAARPAPPPPPPPAAAAVPVPPAVLSALLAAAGLAPAPAAEVPCAMAPPAVALPQDDGASSLISSLMQQGLLRELVAAAAASGGTSGQQH